MSKSNEKLSVHLRVYRGKTLSYNAQGEVTTENHLVKLEHNTAEYKRFLSMLRANGFIEVKVEKVLNISKPVEGKTKDEPGYYEEVKDFKDITKEVNLALNPDGAEKELTADQKKIADLEAKLDAFMNGGNKAKEDSKKTEIVKTDEDKKVLTDALTNPAPANDKLKNARDKYLEVFGKKGHHSWTVEEIEQKIAEFKPE